MLTKLFFIVFFSFVSCNSTHTQSKDSCEITVNFIKESLLNKQISTIDKQWHPCFQQKDTIITSDENDALNWNAKMFYFKGKIAFVAEANWQDKHTISRITIVSKEIKTKSGIYIGQKFEDIKLKISNRVPIEPDGYLSLVDKQDLSIFFSMDITRYPKLFYGVSSLNEIPKSVKVENIIIINRR